MKTLNRCMNVEIIVLKRDMKLTASKLTTSDNLLKLVPLKIA